MSYTKLTDFATKDSLLSGNPSKLVRGTELDAEFNAIQVADALNLKSADAATTYVTKVEEQNATGITLGSVSGTNTITAAATPTLTGYSNGQTFRFVAAGANTGAVTINIDSNGAKAITKNGATALIAGDIASGSVVQITYDGTQFQLISGAGASGSFAASGSNSDITSLNALTSAVKDVRQLQPISASIGSNAITISASALSLEFRSTTLTSGAVSFVQGTPASLTIASTDSFGLVTAAGNQRIAILAINNAGTIELAASALYGGVNLDETGVITTAATATTATAIKAANVRTGVAYKVVGFVDATFTTATGWGSLVTVQGQGGQALAAMSSLGYGQTWQNVTGSRAAGTTYYNTTGKPISVEVTTGPFANTNITATVNGVAMGNHYNNNAGGGSSFSAFVVPAGQSYSVAISSGGLGTWLELR